MQDRGLAAYIAELVGTLLLVFFITSVVVLYVATGQNAQFGSDFAVVGLTHFLLLFGLIISIGVASGGHFNPAVTAAFIVIRRIDPIDGLVYILAQLSGGVLGALLTKAFLLDEGRASDYGTPKISALLGGAFQGAMIEGIGAFVLVLVVLSTRAQSRGPPLGRACHRRCAWLPGDGVRSADRRFVQPGPLVRPGARRKPLRGRVGLHRRPASSVACSRRSSTGSSSSRPAAPCRSWRTPSPRAARLRPRARLRRCGRSARARAVDLRRRRRRAASRARRHTSLVDPLR